MGGSLSAKSRYNRWVMLVSLGVILAVLFAAPIPIRAESYGPYNLDDYPNQTETDDQKGYIAGPPLLESAAYLPVIESSTCGNILISPHAITDTYTYLGWQKNMIQIHADVAWKGCNLGSPLVTVAVVDTGVDLNHPDLAGNLLSGIDFVSWDNDPQDLNGHGTHVSGIIAAGLNGVGIVGVAPQIRILPVRVLDQNGSGYTWAIAEGIRWAADKAQVINLSLGGPTDSDFVLQRAVDYAEVKGRLVIAAAGNCGNNNQLPSICGYANQPLYPAAYPNVMAVSAVDASDRRAEFSNIGDYVDVAAPGTNIWSTYWDDAYIPFSGTSQAAPHVSGLAALVWSRFPDYSAAQVRAAIESSAFDAGPTGRDPIYGWGRIDAAAALGMSGTLSASVSDLAEPAEQTQPVEDRQAEILDGWVLVQYQPGVSPERIEQALGMLSGVELESVLPEIGIHRLRVPPGQEWKVIDRLRAQPEVLYAGPEYLYQAQ